MLERSGFRDLPHFLRFITCNLSHSYPGIWLPLHSLKVFRWYIFLNLSIAHASWYVLRESRATKSLSCFLPASCTPFMTIKIYHALLTECKKTTKPSYCLQSRGIGVPTDTRVLSRPFSLLVLSQVIYDGYVTLHLSRRLSRALYVATLSPLLRLGPWRSAAHRMLESLVRSRPQPIHGCDSSVHQVLYSVISVSPPGLLVSLDRRWQERCYVCRVLLLSFQRVWRPGITGAALVSCCNELDFYVTSRLMSPEALHSCCMSESSTQGSSTSTCYSSRIMLRSPL